ncbi:unnamed protein product [Ranitomeya imitator]|uniref:Uncharacterized protein n=1 Tax=Ranitomeya imitator TaxID=111125 RepID=A0ABN9ME21_9NEOB|nr:unnamed protein product [Ranitomeya imitator]
MDYKGHIPGVKPVMTNRQHQKLLTWVKKKKNWTVAQWFKVLFSNEKCIAVSRDHDVAVSRDRYVIISRDRNAWTGHQSVARNGKVAGSLWSSEDWPSWLQTFTWEEQFTLNVKLSRLEEKLPAKTGSHSPDTSKQFSSSMAGMKLLLSALLIGLCAYYFYSTETITPEMVKGKRVLVTGSSSGIGEQIAYRFSEMGAHVMLTARRAKQLQEVAKKCLELGAASASYVVADMENLTLAQNVGQEAIKQLDNP